MSDYERIARVIEYLDGHDQAQPDPRALATVAGLSPYHFHRLFVRWAGATPEDFLQCLTVEHAKRLLARGEDVLSEALSTGLSGPGRLPDPTVRLEAASPRELKRGGEDWTIRLGVVESPIGFCLIGGGPRGVCQLSFVESCDRAAHEAAVRARWPAATLRWDPSFAKRTAAQVFRSDPAPAPTPLRAFVRGTRFQVQVWSALLHVPAGALVSYGMLARAVGRPGGARAVGSAVGRNPLGVLIPCHRVIRESGAIGGFSSGVTRKQALLAWEQIGRN